MNKQTEIGVPISKLLQRVQQTQLSCYLKPGPTQTGKTPWPDDEENCESQEARENKKASDSPGRQETSLMLSMATCDPVLGSLLSLNSNLNRNCWLILPTRGDSVCHLSTDGQCFIIVNRRSRKGRGDPNASQLWSSRSIRSSKQVLRASIRGPRDKKWSNVSITSIKIGLSFVTSIIKDFFHSQGEEKSNHQIMKMKGVWKQPAW